MVEMNKERIEHWARHPLVVGLFSTVIFGLIVAGVGSWFQHKNWKKQEEIARQKTQQEKLFDKRTEIAAKVFYVIKKREINAWSMFGACNDPGGKSDFVRYWEIRGEIICEDTSLRHLIAIYFGLDREIEILKTLDQIHDGIWHDVEDKLSNVPECKQVTKEFMYQKTKQSSELENKIIERFRELLYSKQ